MKLLRFALILAILGSWAENSAATAATTTSFSADIWADNWFALYVNGVKVAQDPVPLTTTKSFNKVSVKFTAKYPLTIALIGKDYVENQSGLEYIGSSQQQIGDAGIIAQIHEKASGKLVAATSKAWKSYVTFRAPLNPECVTSVSPLSECKSSSKALPTGWTLSTYKDSGWQAPGEYSESAVGVKDGYSQVKWDPRAHLIWSSSLTLDNTVLFRTTAKSAMPTTSIFGLDATGLLPGNHLNLANTCDGSGTMPSLKWQNVPAGTKSLLLTMDTVPGPARPGETEPSDFNHLVQFNIGPTIQEINNSLSSGSKGKNFKGSLGYTPPCSQGPGEKTYTFHLYALSAQLTGQTLTGPEALAQAKNHLLGEATLSVFYSRA